MRKVDLEDLGNTFLSMSSEVPESPLQADRPQLMKPNDMTERQISDYLTNLGLDVRNIVYLYEPPLEDIGIAGSHEDE